MGSCTRRHFLLSICFLQLLTIIERQVFDFLGYMWAPILTNFFHIIFVIFGFFGAYQFRAKYIITYSIWNFLWIGWNVFIICFYLSVGILDKNSDLLNLGTGSVSWFEVNGFGCKPFFPTNVTSEDPYRPVRPERVDNCLLDYPQIEIIHAAIQIILSVLGLIGAIFIAKLFLDEDDRFDFMGGDAKSPQHTVVHPMYVSYSCIPTATSATKSPKVANANKPNASNTNSLSSFYNTNRKHSHLSYDNKPEIRYTELSTEQLVNNNFDDGHENYSLKHLKSFQNNSDSSSENHGYIPQPRPNRNFHAYENEYAYKDHQNNQINSEFCDSFKREIRSDLNMPKFRNANNQFVQQVYPNQSDMTSEKYCMPYQYISHSPNLNRSASRRRQDKPHINVYDQIRDAPPGYLDNYSIQRAKSQDRLSHRRNGNSNNNKARPRSHCSNIGFPEQL